MDWARTNPRLSNVVEREISDAMSRHFAASCVLEEAVLLGRLQQLSSLHFLATCIVVTTPIGNDQLLMAAKKATRVNTNPAS